MASLTYTDLLDTVRPPEDDGLALAALKCSLLRGGTPVLSTSQAFDLRLLLHEVTSAEGLPVFDLFRSGHIQVRWWKEDTIRQAFAAALRRDDFVFSAWPEVHDPIEGAQIRGALLDTLDDDKTTRLPVGVAQRMQALLELDGAERAFSPRDNKRTLTPTSTLAENLSAILKDRGNAPEEYRPLLQRLLTIKSRSDGYRVIDGNTDAPHEVRRGVRELLDVCYNRVMAQSVGATEAVLTVSSSALQHIIDDALTDHRAPVSLRHFAEDDLTAVPLQVVEWSSIKTFLTAAHGAPDGERQLELRLKKLMFETACGQGKSVYGLLTRKSQGVVGLAIIAFGGILAPFSVVAGGVAGALGSLFVIADDNFSFLSPYLARWAEKRVAGQVEGWVDRQHLLKP
jgi:hypothetical protein